MSAIIRQLTDDEQQKIYPVTRSNAVYMKNGKQTVDDAIGDIMDGDTIISFEGGNIVTTLQSGNVITTTFPNDGSIVETCNDSDGVLLWTRTTTFNEDGSIETHTVYPDAD